MRHRKTWIVAISLLAMFILAGGVVVLARNRLPGSGLPSVPVPAVPISAGNFHSMAVTEDGRLWAWGSNSHGQLGDGTDTNRLYPVMIMENVVAVSTNIGQISWSDTSTHNMVLTTDGTLWVWGVDIREANRQVMSANRIGWGRPSRPYRNLRIPIRIMENVVSISASSGHATAITSDGVLWGWGKYWRGQLGDSVADRCGRPVKILYDVAFVSAGASRTTLITSNGTLLTSGNRSVSQADDNTNEEHRNTVNRGFMEIMEDVIYVSAGMVYTMVITSDNVLWGWGYNRDGQLDDDGATEVRSNPIPMKIMDDVVAVSTGGEHTMAITSDGILWGWGSNRFGQLGDGTTSESHSPVQIMDDVAFVSTGYRHTIAVTSDGVLWAWGSNWNGELGDGTTVDRHSPVRIMEGILVP